MRAALHRFIAAALSLCLAAAFGLSAQAASPAPSVTPTPAHDEDGTLPVYIDGLLYARALSRDGALFISPECMCVYLDCEMDWTADAKSLSLSVPGAELKGDSSHEYMTANGRYLYEPEGWIVEDGTLYLPVDAIERIFGVSVRQRAKPERVELSTKNAAVIAGGEDYYELNYPNEELFWLAQIIHSEAFQQPLAGMIGVGNVVMNRVASPLFPDTVFDVVFDVGGIVQFEPVSTGGIYVTPDEQSQIAARLCLEGYNTVGDSLYFVNPSKGSYWFDETLEFVMAIGDHNFYR